MPIETQSGDGQLLAMVSTLLVEQGKVGAQLAVVIEQLKAIPDHEQRIRELRAAVPNNLEPRLVTVEAAIPPNLEHRLGALERSAAKAIGWALGSGLFSGGGVASLLAYLHH